MVWVGFGNSAGAIVAGNDECSFVQIISIPSGASEARLKIHNARIICMKLVDKHVWTCSLNRTINILDTKTRQSIHLISNLPDAISCMDVVRPHVCSSP